jgi:hypothetical protein
LLDFRGTQAEIARAQSISVENGVIWWICWFARAQK